MRRREFIAVLLSAVASSSARAQRSTKVYHIAFVDPLNTVARMTETGGVQRTADSSRSFTVGVTSRDAIF